MSSPSMWVGLEQTGLGSTIASSTWLFPTIETFHVIAIVTVIGTIAAMDLRLLGLTSGSKSISAMERDTLPVIWVAFAFAVLTGLLLFVSKAASYMANPYFLWKMGLMLLAGVNMAIFHRVLSKDIGQWDVPGAAAPAAAKIAGLLSLALWIVIPFCGRAIGFTLGVYY